MYINLKTPREVREEIASRFKARRLALNMKQIELASRSGVTWSSLRRFEREALISLDSLLRLALVLECLGDFDNLAADDQRINTELSFDALMAKAPVRKRASREVRVRRS